MVTVTVFESPWNEQSYTNYGQSDSPHFWKLHPFQSSKLWLCSSLPHLPTLSHDGSIGICAKIPTRDQYWISNVRNRSKSLGINITRRVNWVKVTLFWEVEVGTSKLPRVMSSSSIPLGVKFFKYSIVASWVLAFKRVLRVAFFSWWVPDSGSAMVWRVVSFFLVKNWSLSKSTAEPSSKSLFKSNRKKGALGASLFA